MGDETPIPPRDHDFTTTIGLRYFSPDTPFPATVVDGWRFLASPGLRLRARVIDLALILTAIAVLLVGGWAAANAMDTGDSDSAQHSLASVLRAVDVVLTVGVAVLYEPMCIWRWGATLGKLAAGIRVVRLDSGTEWPTFGQSLGRFMALLAIRVVPFGALLDSLWLLWDRPLYQCLHDKVAATVVIHDWP